MTATHIKQNTIADSDFQRSSQNLRKKFYQFLLPSILTNMAIYLSQFLDSIVVAQTLGSQAMAMVNMASPLVLAMSTIYLLLGSGGVTIYSTLKGKLEKELAASILSLTMLMAVIASIIYVIVGIVLNGQIITFLSDGLKLGGDFSTYVLVLTISAPIVIILQVLTLFLPAEGKPQYTTAINVIANVVNIICDYVYIMFFHLGLAGAAFATLTGYVVGMLFLIYILKAKKISLSFGPVSRDVLRRWLEPITTGMPSALNQFGFFVKVSFSNNVAVLFAGATGVVVFSACFMTVTFITIFLGGFIAAMCPLVAMLYGQKDYQGISLLMKRIIGLETAWSLVLFVIFELWPAQILSLFDIVTAQDLSIGIPALRIFSFMYLLRQTVVLFMYYFQLIGNKKYAVTISLLDGFIGIVILTGLFCWGCGMGITGLWLAYPCCSLVLLLGILCYNCLRQKKSNGNLQGIFLLPAIQESTPVVDISLPGDEKDVAKFTEILEEVCLSHGIGVKKAYQAAVACEEICVYSIEQANKLRIEIDTFVQMDKDKITLSFRSIGPPFDTMMVPKDIKFSNIELLIKLADEIRYDYIMGMNYTKIVLKN